MFDIFNIFLIFQVYYITLNREKSMFGYFYKEDLEDIKASAIIKKGFKRIPYPDSDYKKDQAAISEAMNDPEVGMLIRFVLESLKTASIKVEQKKSSYDSDKLLFDDDNYKPLEFENDEQFKEWQQYCADYIKRILTCGTPSENDYPQPLSKDEVIFHLKTYIFHAIANMQKCIEESKFILTEQNIYRFILASFLVTNKFIFDEQFKENKNLLFSKVDEIDAKKMSELERAFLRLCDFKLVYYPQEIDMIKNRWCNFKEQELLNAAALPDAPSSSFSESPLINSLSPAPPSEETKPAGSGEKIKISP